MMSGTYGPGIHGVDTSPLTGAVGDLQPIRLQVVDQTCWEPVWDDLMRKHHYLGYGKMVGASLKYLAFSHDRPIAALGFRAAAFKIKPRDDFIGWSPEKRKRYLSHLANNNRFLIFPWVEVENLGSHLLSRAAQALSEDWRNKYGHPIWLLETFVDPRYFDGTIYKAANWIHLGRTRGYTKDGATYRYHGNSKDIFVSVIKPRFRTLIGCQQREHIPRPPSSPKPPFSFMKEARSMLAHQTDWHPEILAENGITEEQVSELTDLLLEFHETFRPAFQRAKQRLYGTALLKGLLSDLDRKCLEPIALRYLGTRGVRALQRFINNSPWDEKALKSLYLKHLADHLAAEDDQQGVLTIDATEFVKKGKESVGVARQYCGRLGKVDNCQSGVFIGYTSPKGYGLIDCQLYMPKVWFSDEYAERRTACHVPKDLTFKTKTQIAQDLLKKVSTEDLFPAQWVVCDAAFGNNPAFRAAVAAEDMYYFADISSDTSVWLENPHIEDPEDSKPSAVREVAEDPNTHWQTHTLAEGAKGPIISRIARRRVFINHNKRPGEQLWLVLRKNPNGKIKYFLCNAPEETPLSEMARICTLRWPVEQSFQQGKSELGMDQYEHRSWHGWYRFMIYVFLAMLFLLQLQQRFKKKAPNSPS